MHRRTAPQFDKNQMVVGIFYLSLLKQVLEHAGCRLRGYQGTPRSLHDHRTRMTLSAFFHSAIRSLAKAPAGLGFDYGNRLNLVAADTVGQLLMSSSHLHHALDYLQRYQVLLGVCLDIKVREHKGTAQVSFNQLHSRRLPNVLQWFVSEALLTCVVRQSEWLTGKHLPLKRVCVPYPPPPHSQRYARELGCEVCFDAQTQQLIFDASYLNYPILTANPELCDLKARHCESALRKRQQTLSTTTLVKQKLAQHCPTFPTIDAMAEQLHTSRSCLYRRLQEENTSYQILINELKRDTSITLLGETMMTITDIADKLGFSDASSFRRAFKNWTGMQPSSFRELKQC